MNDPFNTNAKFMAKHGKKVRRIRRARARLMKSFFKRGHVLDTDTALKLCLSECHMIDGHIHLTFRGLRLLWIDAYRTKYGEWLYGNSRRPHNG